MNMDPAALEAALTSENSRRHPGASHRAAGLACAKFWPLPNATPNLVVLEDCAQAIGAKLDGKPVGGWGQAGAFSCHPLKNLFAFGDATDSSYDQRSGPVYRQLWLARSHGMPDRNTCRFLEPQLPHG